MSAAFLGVTHNAYPIAQRNMRNPSEIQIEDLKLQLDYALGAEEVLVQLTERSLMLGEVSQVNALPNRANTLLIQEN